MACGRPVELVLRALLQALPDGSGSSRIADALTGLWKKPTAASCPCWSSAATNAAEPQRALTPSVAFCGNHDSGTRPLYPRDAPGGRDGSRRLGLRAAVTDGVEKRSVGIY
jgi:hypothetical protein